MGRIGSGLTFYGRAKEWERTWLQEAIMEGLPVGTGFASLVGLCSDRMCGLLGLGSLRITGFIKELRKVRDLGILGIGFWS